MDKTQIVELDRGDYTTCTVNLQGATVTSWRIKDQELLFVSRQSQSHEFSHIKGGIQLIFPHFGPWSSGPKHGFARTLQWVLEEGPKTMETGDVFAVLSLCDDSYTKALWDHKFKLVYKVTLYKHKLVFKIYLENSCSNKPFDFHIVQHSLFRVPDVTKCEVIGLQTCPYKDASRNDDTFVEDKDAVTFSGYTNKMYQHVPGKVSVKNMLDGTVLNVYQKHTSDFNLWNPGAEQSATTEDLVLFHEEMKPSNVIVLDRGERTICTINLLGATVTSWRVKDQEMLFMSRNAQFSELYYVRGGIQFVFPAVGWWDLGPKDGFARMSEWTVEEGPEMLENGDVYATICLNDNNYTRSIWNYKFKLYYKVTLLETKLRFDLGVENFCTLSSLDFVIKQNALMRVPDITKCEVIGFQGLMYRDTLKDKMLVDDGASVKISRQISRNYFNAPDEVRVRNTMKGGMLRVTTSLCNDIMLWNPWKEQCLKLHNIDNDEYQYFIAVEAGVVSNSIRLEPLSCWAAYQTFEFIEPSKKEKEQVEDFYDLFNGFC